MKDMVAWQDWDMMKQTLVTDYMYPDLVKNASEGDEGEEDG